MKLKRVTFYFVDHDKVDDAEIKEIIENQHYPNRCMCPEQTKVDSVDIGEWNDDHRCNYKDYDLAQEFIPTALEIHEANLISRITKLQSHLGELEEAKNERDLYKKEFRLLQGRVREHNIRMNQFFEINPIVHEDDFDD